MSFARSRIVLVAVSIQTDYETEGKGVSGMRSLHSGIPQDAQKAVQQGRRRVSDFGELSRVARLG
jgi:hypothetical protein